MKHTILSLLVAACLAVSCGPTTYQTESSNAGYIDVPVAITTSFNTQYPTATNITWGMYDPSTVIVDFDLAEWPVMDVDDYAVAFDMEGERYYSWYDTDGNWIGTAYTIRDHTSLPSGITAMLHNKYMGYTVEEVDKEFRNDRVAYELKLRSGDSRIKLLVDANGNILKERVK